MREQILERRLVEGVKKLGGIAFKFTSPGNTGVPDRLILINGRAYFAEVKAPGKKLRPIQKYRKKQIEDLGLKVFIVDSEDSLEVTLDEIRAP